MRDQHQQIRDRTESFSFRIIRLVKTLPQGREADVVGKQVLRSGTSIAANYRAVGCCRTKSEFVNKLRIVLEEADETVYWLECIRELGLVRAERMDDLINEAKQLAPSLALRCVPPADLSREIDQITGCPDVQMTR